MRDFYPTYTLWLDAANAALSAEFGISFTEAGADEVELQTLYRLHMGTGEKPWEAAENYAFRHDLVRPDPMTAERLRRDNPIPPPPASEPGPAAPDHVANAVAPVFLPGSPGAENDPNAQRAAPWGCAPNEGFAGGNYGTLCFDLTTGAITRHFPGVDYEPGEAGYLDIAKVDIPALQGALNGGEPFATGALFDIIDLGFWTLAGDYEPPCDPVDDGGES